MWGPQIAIWYNTHMARTTLSELVVKVLKKQHLLTAPEILDKLETKEYVFNKTSLYRALDKLVADEVVCKQAFAGNEIYYELRGDHHDHVVCSQCGLVEALECQTEVAARINNYQIDHHHLTMYGVCPRCQKKAPKASVRPLASA